MTKKEELESLKNQIKSTIKSSKAMSQRESMADLHQNSNHNKSLAYSASTNKLSILKSSQSRYKNSSTNNISPPIPHSQQAYIKSSYTIEDASSQSALNNPKSIHTPGGSKVVRKVDWTKFENKLKPQTPVR